MAESIQSQMVALRLSIQGLEAQRAVLGDKIVDPALATLRSQLSASELGLILMGMGDAAGAARRFSEAHALAASQGIAALSCESSAYLAACTLMQGQLDMARSHVEAAWDYLKEHAWVGYNHPGLVYRVCAETFDALGEIENVRAVLDNGHQALMEVADKIKVPEWRRSSLENVPEHRAILEMWERLKN